MAKLERLQKWLIWMLPILVGSITLYWFITRDSLPREIPDRHREQGGLYHRSGEVLVEAMERREDVEVLLAETDGSAHDRQLLIQKKADLAVLQAGSVEMDGLAGLVPLYPDVMLVIVREGRGIHSIAELVGKRAILGPMGSGMRRTAESLMSHHGVQILRHEKESTYFFPLLLQDDTLDGATVTTGLLNPDLNGLLATGDFELLAIPDAEALAIRHSHLSSYTIPQGFFSGSRRVPEEPIQTIATMAFLAARWDASDALITTTLDALYTADLRADARSRLSSRARVLLPGASIPCTRPRGRSSTLTRASRSSLTTWGSSPRSRD